MSQPLLPFASHGTRETGHQWQSVGSAHEKPSSRSHGDAGLRDSLGGLPGEAESTDDAGDPRRGVWQLLPAVRQLHSCSLVHVCCADLPPSG